MMNSNFVTTTGIHHEDHYTTAYDLTFLLKAAYNDPWIREVSEKQTYEMKSKNQTLGVIENKNKHIGLFGNVLGKTGYTGEAGRCFAGVYERDGKVIGNVILNSDKTDNANVLVFEDTLKMIDSAFEEDKVIKLSKAEEVGVITVSYKPYKFIGPTKEIDVPVKSVDTISYYGNDINLSETSLDLSYKELSAGEIKEETIVGTATIKERQVVKSVNLVSTLDVQEKILKTHLFSYILIALITLTVVVLFVVVTVNNKRKKAARRRRIESARRSKKFVDDHRSNRFR